MPHRRMEIRVKVAYLMVGLLWFMPLMAPIAVRIAYSGYRRALADPTLEGRAEAMGAMIRGTAVTGIFVGVSLLLAAAEVILPLFLHLSPVPGAGVLFAVFWGLIFGLCLGLVRRARRARDRM
jgi:hypothetical protein